MLLIQLFLRFGLKQLWNLMNMIQYLIFMQMWLMGLPNRTRVFLRELKALALLEFIPYEWLSGSEKTMQGSSAGDEDLVSEELGIDRFGSNSLVQGLGSMLILAITISVIILLVLCLRLLSVYSSRLKSLYAQVKKKIKYNLVLRYVL